MTLRLATTATAYALLALASACKVSTFATFQSNIDTEGPIPFTKLLIFANVQRGRFPHAYSGFKTALIKQLESCGIESVLVDAGHRVDLEQVFDRLVARFRPTAVLTIDVEDSDMTRLPVVADTLQFKLTFHDVVSGKTIWVAQSTLHLGKGRAYEPAEAGRHFSMRIIEQLQSDRVMKHCPAHDQ